jgi:hypothetical protein
LKVNTTGRKQHRYLLTQKPVSQRDITKKAPSLPSEIILNQNDTPGTTRETHVMSARLNNICQMRKAQLDKQTCSNGITAPLKKHKEIMPSSGPAHKTPRQDNPLLRPKAWLFFLVLCSDFFPFPQPISN